MREYAVGNQWIERGFVVDHGRLAEIELRNLVARRAIRTGIGGFDLLIDGRRITLAECRLAADSLADADGGRVFRLEVEQMDVVIDLHHWPATGRPWLYKQVKVTNVGEAPLTMQTVDVEWLAIEGEAITYAVPLDHVGSPPGFHEAVGQPVFTESFFFGLEFPHSLSGVDRAGDLRLRHFPGRVIAPGESWQSKRAVVGVSAVDRVRDQFDQYCLALRPFTDPYQLKNWLCCWLAVEPNVDAGTAALAHIKQRLIDECGGWLDAFDPSALVGVSTYDVPQGYLTEGLWEPAARDLHDRLSQASRDVGIPYGMYFGLGSFFPFTGIAEWGKAQGFGVASESAFCFAEPTYRAALTERILDSARRYQLGEITLDMMWQGNGFGCRTPGHGHLVSDDDPIGRYGTEAVVDAHLDLFSRLRAVNPEILISLMSYDCWGSPWWLAYVDVVHAVNDDTPPSQTALSPRFRDLSIACRDEQLFEMYGARQRTLPMWGNDSFMGLQVRRPFISQGYRLANDLSLEQWEDELVMGAVGHLHSAFVNLVDYPFLDESSSGIQFYADVLAWARDNRHTLFDTRMILGDPRAGEAFGYLHRGHDETLVCLRNPSMETTEVTLHLDEDLFWTDSLAPAVHAAGTSVNATQIYPYREDLGRDLAVGGVLRVELSPRQAHVLRLKLGPDDAAVRVVGARHRVIEHPSGKREVALLGEPGTSARVRLDAGGGAVEESTVFFPGLPILRPRVASAAAAQTMDGGTRRRLEIKVDARTRAQLQVYVGRPGLVEAEDGTDPLPPLPALTVRHFGEGDVALGATGPAGGSVSVRPRAHPGLTPTMQVMREAEWHSWYLVDLAPGANRVEIISQGAALDCRLGAWIETVVPLNREVVPLAGVGRPLNDLPMLRWDERIEVAEALPLGSLHADRGSASHI